MSRPFVTRQVIEQVAERRIRQLIDEGGFDDLAGAGKPIEGIDEPYDPLWWVRGWIRREGVTGGELVRVVRAMRADGGA